MKTLVASILIAIASVASANEFCESVGKFAEITMRGRQSGVPMSQVMKYATERDNEMLQAMIMEAYNQPRYSSKEYQDRAVADFRNVWELACYKEQRKSST